MLFSTLLSATLALSVICVGSAFRANETELLAYQALQAYASLPKLHQLLTQEIRNSVQVKAIPNLFAQQNGVEPKEGSYQLENFGALVSWDSILQLLAENPNRRLLILIRHGQAWENLNPTSNANCEFELNGKTIQNFDSPLTPLGREQAANLNAMFLAPASNDSTKTWFETIGLQANTTSFLSSPLSRTMQTSEGVFASLPLSTQSNQSIVVHELIRATIGRDVCNFRHSVRTPTSATALPFPFATGCQLPDTSLQQLYGASPVHFSFPIRPAGGEGFGVVSDADQLWRADVADDEVLESRATAFLGQLPALTPPSSSVAVVTHGEMVSAIYRAAGENSYGPKNTEVVPLLIEFPEK
jgi:broad specificity phosphatase PhoE